MRYLLLTPILISYFIGAIPFGFIIAKTKGVDIRTRGSGNIGATNVFRAIGKGWGIFTFILDVAKGFIAAYLLPIITLNFAGGSEIPQWLSLACACSAVAGHNWPVFLKFKGGKGIATTAGAILGIAPAALGAGMLAWLIIFPTSRYVSLASIIAAIVMGITGWFFYSNTSLLIPSFLTILALLAVIRHKTNIQRLLKGTENQFEFKKKAK